MAKRIIVLDQARGDRPQFRVCYWAAVPVAQQRFFADPAAKSAFLDALPAEITAIQSGAVVERVETMSADPPKTMAEIRMIVQARWVAFQAEVAASTTFNNYGLSWDGTTWSPGL